MDFEVLALLDKVGAKDAIKDKAARQLSKRLETLLRKTGATSPQVRMQLIQWSQRVTGKVSAAVDKTDVRLRRAGVRNSLAEAIEDELEDRIEPILREFRQVVGSLASSGALYDKGADDIADLLVEELFRLLDPTITFDAWAPAYQYSLTATGQISTIDVTQPRVFGLFLKVAER